MPQLICTTYFLPFSHPFSPSAATGDDKKVATHLRQLTGSTKKNVAVKKMKKTVNPVLTKQKPTKARKVKLESTILMAPLLPLHKTMKGKPDMKIPPQPKPHLTPKHPLPQW